MAAREAELRGSATLTDALLTPRTATRVFLLLVAVGIAHFSWQHLPVKLLAYLAGLAGPFCLLCAGVIWSLREKADEALSGDDLPPERFAACRNASRLVRRRMAVKAAYVVVCALLAIGPAVSNQLVGPVWQWMVFASVIGVAEAAYSYVIANSWEEELIELKDRQRFAAKSEARKLELVTKLKNARRVA